MELVVTAATAKHDLAQVNRASRASQPCQPGESAVPAARVSRARSASQPCQERESAVPGAPEGGVGSIGCDQLVVRAELRDPAILNNSNAISVMSREEPVRDSDNGPPR
jgi:hypothetical protein